MKYEPGNIKIAVIGLGYVGLPLAVEFSKVFDVIGFDLNNSRIEELKKGYDRTDELAEEELKNLPLKLSTDKSDLGVANVYIITVPTPVDSKNVPDLSPLISATQLVGNYLAKNNIVIFESTVYPGCTEEKCVPCLEKESNLLYNIDFFCGYSPERINPGDKKHTLTKIKKITSGSNPQCSEFVDKLYSEIIIAGTYPASSISVAEAAKVIENTQRDVNIALMNELSIIFDKLNLDTKEILEAAETKWNFLPFKPGLVGGHCIGVDPYYLTHKAVEVGYHPEIILGGRRINDNMGKFIAEKTISELTKNNISPLNAEITILGLTFKENCSDLRNTKVITIIEHLKNYDCIIQVSDSRADIKQAKNMYNLGLTNLKKVKSQDALIIAVEHDEYKDFDTADFKRMIKPNGALIDVKSIYQKSDFEKSSLSHWRL
tara:strand:+ start:19033 stop:20328 length:1296 start_codon:yes stop_codon:yes gene_type:complete